MALRSHACVAVHELAIMESVVETVAERLRHERVATVRLEIGELACVDVDALRFCFEVCISGTRLAGAELAIERVAGRARCRTCGQERALHSLIEPCACGSFDHALLAGDELRLKDVEVL